MAMSNLSIDVYSVHHRILPEFNHGPESGPPSEEGGELMLETNWYTGIDTEMVERARSLRELISADAEQGQIDRQVTQRVLEAMDRERLMNMLVPRRLGGPGANVRTMIEALIELGKADASACWTAALVNACTWFCVAFSDQAQQDVWGDNPNAKACGIFIPGSTERVDGGYLLTGEYPYASGNSSADVATLGMLIEGPDGEPVMAMGIVPKSSWTIRDTWYTLGMRGTGSNTLVVENVFVPDYAVMTFADLGEGRYATSHYDTEAISRAAFLPVGTVIHATSAIGAAKAALEYTLEKLPHRGVAYTIYPEARNSPTHHIAVAEAASNIDAAHLLLARACDDIDEYAARGEYPDALARARMRMDTSHAATLCRDAIDKLMTANGAGAFAEKSLLGRIWRDANTGGRHSFATPEIGSEVYGRALLGADIVQSIPV